jgi:beta-galactosidase
MRLRYVLLAVLLSVSLFLVRPAAGQAESGPDANFSLSGTWQFAFAPHAADAEALSNFYKPNADLKAFHDTPVPSNWAMQGYEEPVYKPFKTEASEGFYTRTFTLPAAWKGRRVLLHFGGVWSSAEVWVNGTNMGRHDSGFTSFAMDVSKNLLFGAENRIAVRVRQETHDYLFDTNDDWSLGGIYRDVWLESMPATRWITNVEVRTTFDYQFRDADLAIRTLVNDSRMWPMKADPPFDYEMRFRLSAPDGTVVQDRTLNIALHSGNGRDIPVTMRVATPLPWTAETPNLYTLRVELLEGGKVAHWRTVAVGFRQISTENGVYRINGQAVKLKGVDRHDEYPDVGRATRPQDWLKDLQMMKAANINFIRTSHYPPAEGFLDLCDKMGMYVEDEVPMGFGGDHAADPSFMAATSLRVFETVARDRNHPSIVVWSMGNEDPVTALHIEAMRALKGIDPTRPILMPQQRSEFTPPEADMLAPHYLSPFAYDELGASSTRPILSTEHTHAWSADGVDGFGGFEDKWNELMHHPTAAGAAIWMWADQGLLIKRKTDHGDSPFMLLNPDGVDGIVNADRTPQRDYWETKAVYAPVYPRISSARFSLGDSIVRIPIQNDYDFTNLSNVGIHWQLMEDDRELAANDAKLTEIPHAAAWLDFPLGALKQLHTGATYYALFTFRRSDGSEITRRSVELIPNQSQVPVSAPRVVPLSVDQGKVTAVHAGAIEYRFDSSSARLMSASLNGSPMIGPASLNIWRPMNVMENAVLYPRGTARKDLPDLDKYQVTVGNWRVERNAEKVRLSGTALCVVDAKNRFAVDYIYDVHADGSLTVQYAIDPKVEATFLPMLEVTLPITPQLSRMRWLGLGPIDTYPNEHAAGVFGVWNANAGSQDAAGVKTTRWTEIEPPAPEGNLVRVEDSPYAQFENGTLHVIAGMEGRVMKNRLPEKPEERLDVTPGRIFHGAFTIRLLAKPATTPAP